MKFEKNEIRLEGCNCINCRLERMETAIGKMHESVIFILDKKTDIPGMPKEKNKMTQK
jgi:hypothetical protein